MRTSFGRVWQTLENYPGAVWSARIGAVLTGMLTAFLLAILALLVDLLISQGRVPSFAELNINLRESFISSLPRFSGEERTEALRQVGISDAQLPQFEAPFESLSASNREYLWRAFVAKMLRGQVTGEAADTYAQLARTTDPAFSPGMPGLGSLSLVVRSYPGPLHRLIGWLASWNTWSWRPSNTVVPNYWYLTGLLYLALAVGLLRAGSAHVMSIAAATAALAVSVRLRRAIYHHSYRLGTLAIQSAGASRVTSLFHHHVDTVANSVRERLSSQILGPAELLFLLAFALLIHFWLALAFLLTAIIVLLIGNQIAASYRRRSRRADQRATARMALLQESLGMMRLVKSFGMETFNQSRVERQLTDYAGASSRRIRNAALYRPMVWFLMLLAGAVALYVAGLLVLGRGLGPAQVIALAALIVCAFQPARLWLRHRRDVAAGRESAAVIYEFLDRPPELGQTVGADFLSTIDEGIEFHGVTLREPATGRTLLSGLNLSIAAGERIGVVGASEAEKHALVYLLARILDPSSGEITIDGRDLKWLTLESLRTQIGLVMQSGLVFSDTVANNIGCGESTYTMPQIIEAAKLAHAHQFIQRLPYGYETPLGELGTSLRPGEQFRIALARAILRDPAMYIIEEPVTPLDDETKDLVDDTFDRVLPGKVVLFLPHRISTIRSCDRVCLIHQGRIEAVGEHRDLVTTSGLYKHLHYMEFNEYADRA